MLRPGRDDIVRQFMVWLRQQDDLLKYLGTVEHDQLRNGLAEYGGWSSRVSTSRQRSHPADLPS